MFSVLLIIRLVEHMIYYLAKTGGDARFFPELMTFEQFNELYAKRHQVFISNHYFCLDVRCKVEKMFL